MTRTTRWLRAGAVAAGLALAAGCGPIAFGTGSGMMLSTGPSPMLSLEGCALGSGSPFAARMGLTSSSMRMGVVKHRVAQIQSRYAPGYYSTQAQQSRWKALATGECR